MDFPLKIFRFVFDKYMLKGIKVIVMHQLEYLCKCIKIILSR